MTHAIVIKTSNKRNLNKVKEIALELGCEIELQNESASNMNIKDIEAIIAKGVSKSSFGDPVKWQKKSRKDRKLFS